MLASVFRVKRKKDFNNLFSQNAQSSSSRFCILRKAPNALTISRFGFMISTKTASSAVLRNRLKRQLSEIIRLNIKKIKTGYDIVLIIKRPAVEKKQSELAVDLMGLLAKSRLLQ